MTYTLIALFILTGDVYIEQDNLSLQGCAGQAAIARQDYLAVLPKLNPKVGDIRYICLPSHDARAVTRRDK